MNNTIRNACFAIAVVGALSLSACKSTGDSTDKPATPEAAPAPATDSSTMPATDPTTTPPPATEAPQQDGATTTP